MTASIVIYKYLQSVEMDSLTPMVPALPSFHFKIQNTCQMPIIGKTRKTKVLNFKLDSSYDRFTKHHIKHLVCYDDNFSLHLYGAW